MSQMVEKIKGGNNETKRRSEGDKGNPVKKWRKKSFPVCNSF